jgi:flagellar biosynthesis/type III secretory pathway protein FliH
MRARHLSSKVAGAILGLTLLLVIGVGLSTTAQAQGRYGNQDRRNGNWDGYPNWGGSFDLRQTALNAGYNEGTKEGRNDRARNRNANFQNFSAYQKATKDYNSRLGDRELYRRYYRKAFESGYNTELGIQVPQNRDNRDFSRDQNIDNRNLNRDPNGNYTDNRVQDRRGRNWDRYGSYGGSFNLRQTALNAGYNEGIKQGRNDGRRGRQTDFRNSSAYQKATQDYSSKLGDRELYRRYYREGFDNGYADGYNGN